MIHGSWKMPKLVLGLAAILTLAVYPGIAQTLPSTMQTAPMVVVTEAQGAGIQQELQDQDEQEPAELEQAEQQEDEQEPAEMEQAEQKEVEQEQNHNGAEDNGDHGDGGHGGDSEGGHD